MGHFCTTKHDILLIFSCPSMTHFLVVSSNPELNSNLHHKDGAPLRQQQ